MKHLFLLFVAITAFGSTSFGRSNIRIDSDKDKCVQGWISMDVNVTVNGEGFKFDPSCKFSFDQDFATSKGIKCRINAGMCSSFSPANKIEVECRDGSQESVTVACPQKK